MLYFLYFFLSPYPLFCSFSDMSRNLIMTSGRRWLRGEVDWWAKFDESLTRVKKGRGKVCILAVLLDVVYAQHTGLRTRLITLDVEVVARTPAAPPGCSTWTHPPAVWWSKVAPEAGGTFPPSEGGGGSAEKPDCHPEPDGLICTSASLRWTDPYTCFNRWCKWTQGGVVLLGLLGLVGCLISLHIITENINTCGLQLTLKCSNFPPYILYIYIYILIFMEVWGISFTCVVL